MMTQTGATTMTTPQRPNHGTVFDIASIERDLRKEDAYARTGHTARTLIREPDLRVVQIAMKAGGRISQHRADQTASVHVLSGRLHLHLPSGLVDLGAGQVLALERAVPHDVEALDETTFLLTLGWKNPA
jgi:quercetin dioxygenase-like cupin family protein